MKCMCLIYICLMTVSIFCFAQVSVTPILTFDGYIRKLASPMGPNPVEQNLKNFNIEKNVDGHLNVTEFSSSDNSPQSWHAQYTHQEDIEDAFTMLTVSLNFPNNPRRFAVTYNKLNVEKNNVGEVVFTLYGITASDHEFQFSTDSGEFLCERFNLKYVSASTVVLNPSDPKAKYKTYATGPWNSSTSLKGNDKANNPVINDLVCKL